MRGLPFFGPTPWEGAKRSNIFNYKVNFKYQSAFLFGHLSHALGVGLGGIEWEIIFFPKFNQIWCVLVTHMNGTCNGTFFW